MAFLNIFVCCYAYTHTHTHTHIYIYIYINEEAPEMAAKYLHNKKMCF